MRILFTHAHLIIDQNKEYLDGALLVNDQRIEDVFLHSNNLPDIAGDYTTIDLNGSIVMPGFFDTHTHGISGIDYDLSDKKELERASYENALSGTTSYFYSLSYDLTADMFTDRFDTFNNLKTDYARFAGIHLEGPFISPEFSGAGDPKTFLKPDLDIAKDWLNKTSLIKQVTLAYELDGNKPIAAFLKENNIRVMCGHSGVRADELDDNIDGITHLCNAMKPLHHHVPSLVNAAFSNKYYVELIADGHHINEDVLKLIINNIDSDKIMLITDSAPSRNLEDGEYTFLSKKCIKKDGEFRNPSGALAGSVASINDEMKVLQKLGVKYTDLLAYSSLNAFKFYGMDQQFGSIVKGKYADLVIMDDELNIKNVLVQGKLLNDNILY